jgi:O-antigen/teichoic acid export membrane protein
MTTATVSEAESETATSRAAGPRTSLRRAAINGATLVAIGFGVGQVIKLFSSIILTRLIHPEVYGLMDLAISCMVGIHLFSDLGINPCVVQSRRGEEPAFLRTAWTVQLIRSVFIGLVAAAIAWPVAYLYDRPILFYVLPVIGSLTIAEAFMSLGTFVLTRRVERGLLVLLELLHGAISLVLTILFIYLMRPGPFLEVWHRSRPSLGLDVSLVWAPVLAQLASRTLLALFSHAILPGPSSRLALERDSVKEMLGFAKWVFFSTILTFLGTQIDRFMVPKLAGFDSAGLYGRALGLLGIASGIVLTFNTSVIYPILGRLHLEGRTLADEYPKIHRVLALMAAVVISGLITTGPALTRILYPAEYQDVGWLLQILAVGAWFQMIQDFIGSALLASGRRKAFVVPNAVRAIAMAVVLVPCWWLGKQLGQGNLVGLVVGWVVVNVMAFGSAIRVARASHIRVLRHDLLMTALLGAVTLVGSWLGALAARQLGVATPTSRGGWIVQFLVIGTTTAAVWAGILAWFWRRGAFAMLRRKPAG